MSSPVTKSMKLGMIAAQQGEAGSCGGNRGIMLVSIIVPAYNAATTVGECIQACLDQTHASTEVIVIDDGSTDDTAAVAQSFPISYIHQENRGPAAARNHGARIAFGKIVAFTDADCVPDPDWIESLLRGFEEGTVAVGGTYGIRNESSLLARLIHEEIVLRHRNFNDTVDFLGSFNVAYEKEAFEKAGGFDESFPIASAEDNDLAYRLQDAGGELRFTSDARVAHYHPTKLWPYLRTQLWHGYWRMKLYAKHPRRSNGDRYAGFGDFLGPPLALLLLACVLALPLIDQSYFSIGIVLFAVCYGALTVKFDRNIARRLGAGSGIAFRSMTMLRDLARGIGLIGGMWTFFVIRKGTA